MRLCSWRTSCGKTNEVPAIYGPLLCQNCRDVDAESPLREVQYAHPDRLRDELRSLQVRDAAAAHPRMPELRAHADLDARRRRALEHSGAEVIRLGKKSPQLF